MAIARVLVIEDEEDIAGFIKRGLILKGYDVDVASTGSEGLDILRDHPPDIVLLDLMLPEVDGVEVCKRLRAVSDVPVIMLTALDSVQDKVQGLEAGADDYITKPFAFNELSAREYDLAGSAFYVPWRPLTELQAVPPARATFDLPIKKGLPYQVDAHYRSLADSTTTDRLDRFAKGERP